MQQRRIETEQRIVDSAWEILVEQGPSGLGVNAVAARAGVDKVLIYRYFGGMEGLLSRCGEHPDFWPTTDELLGGPGRPLLSQPPADLARAVIRSYVRALRSRPATLAVLRAECVERNALTAALEEVRERRSLELLSAFEGTGALQTDHQRVLFAIFGAALNYLILRGPDVKVFAGVSLGEPDGLEPIVDAMVRAVLG